MKKSTVVISLVFIMLSCHSPNGPTQLRAPGGKTPVVQGIPVTDWEGPKVIDVWGNPDKINLNTATVIVANVYF